MVRFEEFFESSYGPVVRALTLAFGVRDVAEDAAQVGFERAYRRWVEVSRYDRPDAWVYVVAVREGRRQLGRDRDRLVREAMSLDGSESDHESGADAAVVSAASVANMLDLLTPRQREAVVLRHLAGLSLRDVAEALDVAVGTVKSSLHAAYRTLRLDIDRSSLDEEVRARETR